MKFTRTKLHWLLAIAIVLSCVARPTIAAQSDAGSEPRHPVDEIKPLDGVTRDEAIRLIRQLSDPEFELRQEATRKLWQIGMSAIELLQGVVDSGTNSESRMRAKDLVTLIKAGVTPDTDAEIVRCVVGFLDREMLVQGRAIQKLCFLEQRSIAQKLIALVPSESDRTKLEEYCSVAASDAEVALRLGDQSKFLEWINAPSTRESNRLLYHYNLWIEGKLDDEIERLKSKGKVEIRELQKYDIEKKKEKLAKKSQTPDKNDEAPKQPDLMKLVGLLRFMERWDEAIQFADKVYDRKHRKELTHSILLESGNWNQVASLIVEPAEGDDGELEEDDQHDGLAYPAEGYRKALIHFYAGNEEEFITTIDELEAKITDEVRKQKQRGGGQTEGNSNHAQFLRYTLDFDRALKFTALKKNPATFQLLSISRRYKELFEVFKIGTYEKRARYFKGRIRHIRSLQKQVDYHIAQNDEDQRDVYLEKRNSEISFYQTVVRLLATLGMDIEAEMYFRQLFFEFSDEVTYLGSITALDLQSMGAYQSAWEISEIESKRDKNFNFCTALFSPLNSQEHDVATFLNAQLKSKIEDPIERYRKIATLIKSPLDLSSGKIDFWNEISEVDFSEESDAIKYLFAIWGLDGEKLFEESKSSDETELGDQLMKDGNYLLAAQKFEATALSDGYPVHYARAWHAYRKVGNEEKAKQMRLLFALKFDPEDAYDYTSGYSGTDWQSLPFDAYRLHDCLENTKVGENCYNMWRISENDSKSILSAHQKMVRTQILRLRYIDSPYYESSEGDHPRFIAGSLDAGDIEGAQRWFRKLSTYSPADSGFVENNFPAFRKAGYDPFVDEIFQKVSADFYEILEAYPDSAMYRNNYAWACACAKRNVENGIEIAKQAVDLRPGTAGYYDTLAELYHLSGDNDLAIKTIRRAIELNPMRVYYREQLKKFQIAKKNTD